MNVTLNNRPVNMLAAVALMDDDTRENLHATMPDDATDQEFLDAYVVAHAAKFDGEVFSV